MSLSISLLLMHDAIELLMLAVLDHLQVQTKPRREFMDFWADIKPPAHAAPPDRIPMEALNKLRVGLKHNGNLPNPQSVRDLLPRAKGFFENVLTLYCGLTYSAVSLIDLIPDDEVKTLLQQAKKKFSKDKPAAMTDLKIAFHKLENPAGKHLPKLHAPEKPSMPYEMSRQGWDTYLGQLHSFLSECANRTNALMFGIDPIRYAAFMRVGPAVQWSMAGTPIVSHWSNYANVSPEQFEELISFLIEYALRVSEAYIPLAIRQVSF